MSNREPSPPSTTANWSPMSHRAPTPRPPNRPTPAACCTSQAAQPQLPHAGTSSATDIRPTPTTPRIGDSALSSRKDRAAQFELRSSCGSFPTPLENRVAPLALLISASYNDPERYRQHFARRETQTPSHSATYRRRHTSPNTPPQRRHQHPPTGSSKALAGSPSAHPPPAAGPPR